MTVSRVESIDSEGSIEAQQPLLFEHTADTKTGQDFEVPNVSASRSFRTVSRDTVLILGVVLLCATNIATYLISSKLWAASLDRICVTYTSQAWSPIQRDLDVTYRTKTFNGSFSQEGIYRQPPSPKVDAAWLALGSEFSHILISPDDAQASEISPERHVFVPGELGGPGFPANVEVLHQLHCLNMIRQALYYNADYYQSNGSGPWKDPEDLLRHHINHCLDIVRQRLMCTADIGLLPMVWVEHPFRPIPDFSHKFKCRNFEDIRDWARDHQHHYPEGLDFKPSEGVVVLSAIP